MTTALRVIFLLGSLFGGIAWAQTAEQLQINSMAMTIGQLAAQNAKLSADLQLAQKQIEVLKPKVSVPMPKEKPDAK